MPSRENNTENEREDEIANSGNTDSISDENHNDMVLVDETLVEEDAGESIMMLSSKDAATEPVVTCDFCKGLEDELTTFKKHCKHFELVNEKLTAKVVSRKSLRNDDIKAQYYTSLPSYEILEAV